MAAGLAHAQPYDIIIRNGHIIDGTGSPWYSGDIAIQGGRIAAIGQLRACGNQGRHRRSRHGGGAGIHRHARAVRTDDPGESAPAFEDLSGHHHRDHRRGQLGRAAERGSPHGPAARRLRPLPHHARLEHLPPVFRAARKARHGHQPCELRGRHASSAHGAWRRRTARPPRASWNG